MHYFILIFYRILLTHFRTPLHSEVDDLVKGGRILKFFQMLTSQLQTGEIWQMIDENFPQAETVFFKFNVEL
jgi:hypothetical protein